MTLPFDPLAHIAVDSRAIADAAHDRLDAPIEFCPGWDLGDLIWHVTAVQSFWAQIVERRLTDPAHVVRPGRPPAADLVPALRAASAHLVEVLGAADPHTPVWTWATQQDAAFVIRHQVQEAAVHRVDAEHAAGRPTGIDPVVAGDCIDEFLHVSLGAIATGQRPLLAPLHVAAADTGQTWLLEPAGDRLSVRREARAAPDRIEGPAADVLLWLYGRRPVQALTVTGDPSMATTLRAYAKTD
ncbi:MAG: hypothetical protein JWN61_781 [Pseudonocardiales bacterium]|nr:hypothetical protein [Pseudonocardiales bacterium]